MVGGEGGETGGSAGWLASLALKKEQKVSIRFSERAYLKGIRQRIRKQDLSLLWPPHVYRDENRHLHLSRAYSVLARAHTHTVVSK